MKNDRRRSTDESAVWESMGRLHRIRVQREDMERYFYLSFFFSLFVRFQDRTGKRIFSIEDF